MKTAMRHEKKKVAGLLLAVLFFGIGFECRAEPSGETMVYWSGGKRCHVEGCRRLPKDPAELAKMKHVTFAEAGVPLCSKCPVSKTSSDKKSEKKAASVSEPAGYDKITAYVGNGKRCHVEGCKRLKALDRKVREKMTKMTLAEAIAKGFPPCSKCPVSATSK
jgi:hypothetical protein